MTFREDFPGMQAMVQAALRARNSLRRRGGSGLWGTALLVDAHVAGRKPADRKFADGKLTDGKPAGRKQGSHQQGNENRDVENKGRA